MPNFAWTPCTQEVLSVKSSIGLQIPSIIAWKICKKKAFTPFSAHGNLLQTNPSLSNDEWTTECFMEFQKICTLKIIWNEKWDKSCMLSQLQEGLIIKFCNKQPLQKTLLAWSPEALFFKALNWVSGASVLSRESRICKRWDFEQESFIRTFFYMSLCNQSSFWSPFDRSDFDRSPMDWSPFDRSPFVWSLYDKSLFIQSLWGQVGLFRCTRVWT